MRELMGNKSLQTPKMMNFNDEICTDYEQIANELNIYIIMNECQSNVSTHYEPPGELLDFISEKLPHSTLFDIPMVNEQQIERALLSMNINKATGIDHVSAKYLHMATPVLKRHLCRIINTSITSGTFPSLWKHAKVFPVLKNGKSTDKNNYRPIYILTTLSKILESHVHDAFYQFLNTFDMIAHSQSGFRKFHSCETGLATLISKWHSVMDDNNLIGCINIDLRKAFDLLDSEILCKKLKSYGCSDKTISWFCSYLKDRKQTVYIHSIESDVLPIKYGVPQGSILGPLLFILYINDPPLCLKYSYVHMYADDTSLYVVGKSLNELNTIINTELEHVSNWCNLNKLVVNNMKTNCMLICTPKKRSRLLNDKLDVYIKNTPLENVDSQKVLGILIDHSLKFEAHVDNVCNKLAKLLYLFNQIKHCLTYNGKQMFYNSYFLPCIDYCVTAWGYTNKQNLSKLSRYQKRMGRLILNDFNSPSTTLYDKLGWLTIEEQITYITATLVYKCLYENVPTELQSLFIIRNGRELRNTGINLILPFPNTESRKKCFDYTGAVIWNNLPNNLKYANSLTQFKIRLKKHILNQR